MSDSRSAYTSMKEHFLRNIENSDDLAADDPLNESETVSTVPCEHIQRALTFD